MKFEKDQIPKIKSLNQNYFKNLEKLLRFNFQPTFGKL